MNGRAGTLGTSAEETCQPPAGHHLLSTRTRLQNSPHHSAALVLRCPELMQSHAHGPQTDPADPRASINEFPSQPTHIPAVSTPHVPSASAFPCSPHHAICSYVFLVPLPALQLLLEAPSRPQPLLGQVPDPLLHEAEGFLARANQLQEVSQVALESCLGKEHALRFQCRESSRKRSHRAATGAGGGLLIAAEEPWVPPGWTTSPGATRPDSRAT